MANIENADNAQISSLMEDAMISLHNEFCVDEGGHNSFCSMYFGSINGVFRQFPGVESSRTDSGAYSSYDPRFRPWYVSAASGNKDVVVLIDINCLVSATALSWWYWLAVIMSPPSPILRRWSISLNFDFQKTCSKRNNVECVRVFVHRQQRMLSDPYSADSCNIESAEK